MSFDIVADGVFQLKSSTLALSCLFTVIGFVWLFRRPQSKQNGKEPPSIPEWLPGLGNTYQYVFHNMDFLKYVRDNLKGSTIMKFRMGPKGVYLITGGKSIQSVLRHSGSLSSDELIYMVLKYLNNMTKKDVAKFKDDKSGRSHVPSIDIPEEERIVAPNHRIFQDHLANTNAVVVMADKFNELFSETLSQQPRGKWQTIRVFQFLEYDMARCAIISLFGSQILEQQPDLIDAMWKFDSYVYPMILGVPRFLYSKAYAARDAFHEIAEKHLNSAWSTFSWTSPDANADWEPTFGTRFVRTYAKFLRDRGFSMRSRRGTFAVTLWALNANVLPVTAWALMELVRDKALFEAARKEASSAFENGRLDMNKLLGLPLLQSIYHECLRMHVAVNLTRVVDEDMNLDGYMLKKDYLVQTPSWISHFDEGVWSTPDHPASEFWAERHLKYETKDESGSKVKVLRFSMEGKSGHFFPFGGGPGLCPGRHFARQEVLSVIALIVVNFDIEFEEYTTMDGSTSDRGPQDNTWYCGAASMPPDRDMRIRWKRL